MGALTAQQGDLGTPLWGLSNMVLGRGDEWVGQGGQASSERPVHQHSLEAPGWFIPLDWRPGGRCKGQMGGPIDL